MKDLFVDKMEVALVVRNKTSKTLTYVWVTGKNNDNTYTIPVSYTHLTLPTTPYV